MMEAQSQEEQKGKPLPLPLGNLRQRILGTMAIVTEAAVERWIQIGGAPRLRETLSPT